MKICSKCKKEKSTKEFWKRGDGTQPNCILCQKIINKERYGKNSKQHIAKVLENRQVSIDMFNDWKRTLSCTECKETYTRALDFHHLDPNEKDIEISNAFNRFGWKKLVAELQKCIVLCKVCHVKVHDGVVKVDKTKKIGSIAKFGIAPGSYPDRK